MKTAFLLAAGLLAAAPAFAQGSDINHHARIGAAVRAGCHVQQVHTPAGKLVQNAPVVHCDEAALAALRGERPHGGNAGEAQAVR